MHDALASRSRVAYEPYSDQQRLALMEELQAYLSAGEASETSIDLESVRQMRELLNAMKSIYGKQAAELKRVQEAVASGNFAQGAQTAGDAAAGDGQAGGDGEGVGDANDPKRGMAIGLAPDGATPQGGLSEPPEYQRQSHEGDGEGEPHTRAPVRSKPDEPMSKNEAYVHFKLSEGSTFNKSLVDAKKEAKALKAQRTELAARVNVAKREIDTFREQLDAKRAERAAAAGRNPEDGEIIDEEEYTYIQVRRNCRFATELEDHSATKLQSATLLSHSHPFPYAGPQDQEERVQELPRGASQRQHAAGAVDGSGGRRALFAARCLQRVVSATEPAQSYTLHSPPICPQWCCDRRGVH